MWRYQAPVADMLYLMSTANQAPASWAQMPAFDGLDIDTAREVLQLILRLSGRLRQKHGD